jgi:hypothetical protein
MNNVNLYIVTFRNHTGLHECLESLNNTQVPYNVSLKINVINNHTDFLIDSKFNNVNVMHNTLRPDFSTGHLSRSWNQAIIHGFKNLLNPVSQIVVMCQVDTIFNSDWISRLIEQHKKYNFISAGWGDAFLSFTADGVRNIGLFDERFCNIIHQECDYFNRALIFNRDKSSINDYHHGKILNPFINSVNDNSFIFRKNNNTNLTWNSTVECHEYITKFLISKYSKDPRVWDVNNPPSLIKKLIMFYPYFEFNVFDFNRKYETY